MELLDKFNFALEALDTKKDSALMQEEIIFSSISNRRGFSISQEEFQNLGDALENHFHHILAPMSKRIDFSMANYFSTEVQYKETYALALKNLKQVLSYLMASFVSQVETQITLSSDQIEFKFKNLCLRKREDQRSLLLKIKNNRFYNAKIEEFNFGSRKFYEVTLIGSWSLQKKKLHKSYRSQDGARKGQWENRL